MQVMKIDENVKRKLVAKLQTKPQIISYDDDPALASLCTCLALQYEMGNREFDRLSPFLGVDLLPGQGSPWKSEIVIRGHQFGIHLWAEDRRPLLPRHPDLRFILDPQSLDSHDVLNKALIFPAQIVETFRKKGFNLVIVRDWILNSALHLHADSSVGYLTANQWEVENNIAYTQAAMMVHRQLAFFGTHDIVDHLFGADHSKFGEFSSLYEETYETYSHLFKKTIQPKNALLLLSYLIGVVLDDLAQPKWYGSQHHATLLRKALFDLKNANFHANELNLRTLPNSFHQLVKTLRNKSTNAYLLDVQYQEFISELVEAGASCFTRTGLSYSLG